MIERIADIAELEMENYVSLQKIFLDLHDHAKTKQREEFFRDYATKPRIILDKIT